MAYNLEQTLGNPSLPELYLLRVSSEELCLPEPVRSRWAGLDYLQHGDSMDYIEQFLDFSPFPAPQQPSTLPNYLQSDLSPLPSFGSTITQEEAHFKRQKKAKKTENSPFHNYQKHLNNALKKLIIVPSFGPEDEDFKRAARQIWNRYLHLEVKTKRILHFVFNERNEHPISEAELRSYGLLAVQQTYGEQTVNKAKNYLSKLAIDQIDEQNLDGYLMTRKIKRRDGLKEYILGFRTELQNGYLKRRIA